MDHEFDLRIRLATVQPMRLFTIHVLALSSYLSRTDPRNNGKGPFMFLPSVVTLKMKYPICHQYINTFYINTGRIVLINIDFAIKHSCGHDDSREKNGAPEMLLDLTIFLTNILHLSSSFLFSLLLLCLKFLKRMSQVLIEASRVILFELC